MSPGLPLPNSFQLPVRERDRSGRPVKNMCGRDFLWLCLHRQSPRVWNVRDLPPRAVTEREIFGPDVWPVTGIHLSNAPAALAENGLALRVNRYPVRGYRELVAASICRGPHRKGDSAIAEIHDLVSRGVSCGINLPVAGLGLVTHLMFVAGFVGGGLVVLDTHVAPGIGYRKLTPADDPRCAMLLSFEEVNRRWGRFARVFEVSEKK